MRSGKCFGCGWGWPGVSLKAADLEREAGAVNQQADHDLRIDAALLRITHLAQVIFALDPPETAAINPPKPNHQEGPATAA